MSSTRTAAAVTAGTTIAFFTLYSGYDKVTKDFSLMTTKLKDIFFLGSKSVSYSFDEINKVLGLAGLTLLGGSLIPLNGRTQWLVEGSVQNEVLNHATFFIIAHGLYSSYRYFKRFYSKQKAIPMVFGVIAAQLLIRGNKDLLAAVPALEYASPAWDKLLPYGTGSGVATLAGATAVVALATTHFYTMELNPDGKLLIRPFGLLALVSGVAATSILAFKAFAA